MPTPAGNWKPFFLVHDVATTATVYVCPGIAGIVRQVTFFEPVIASTGTLALSKSGSPTLTSAATIDLNAAAGTTPANQTLATSEATLTLAATDYLKAIFTISSGGSYAGGCVTVWIEPFAW